MNSADYSKKNRPQKIGLTGATGVLGRTLQQLSLKETELEIEWLVYPGRMESAADFDTWYQQCPPLDGVIHLAALVPTHTVDQNPRLAFLSNVEGTVNLLETVRQGQAKSGANPWVFICSTSHVYASSEVPLSESSNLEPISLYGMTKLQSEEWGRVYAARFGLSICIGRVFSYSSPLQPKAYFIPATIDKIRRAARDATLEIFGLHGSRDFLSAEQICSVILQLFRKRICGTFNIASGNRIDLLTVVQRIREKLNRLDVQINAPEVGTQHLAADVRLLNQTGIQVSFHLDHLIESMIDEKN